MLFGPGGFCDTLPAVDWGHLARYVKPTVSNLGFKISQVKLVKSSFSDLRQLAKVKPFLAQQQFEFVANPCVHHVSAGLL